MKIRELTTRSLFAGAFLLFVFATAIAVLLGLTRWQAIHLLPADWYYRLLGIHSSGASIYFVLFFNAAFLYFLWLKGLKRDVAFFGGVTTLLIMLSGIAHGVVMKFCIFYGQADPEWHRLMWLGFRHQMMISSLCAAIGFWYLLGKSAFDIEPKRGWLAIIAFILLALGGGTGGAQYLLSDPLFGDSWKTWNSSLGLYATTAALLLHGLVFTSSVRKVFLSNPCFVSLMLSACFVAGSAVLALVGAGYNTLLYTLAMSGHMHIQLAGGVSLAFMAFMYYIISDRLALNPKFKVIVIAQPYIFAAGIALMSVAMIVAGIFQVPAGHWDITFDNSPFPFSFGAASHFALLFIGVGALIAFIGLMMFVLIFSCNLSLKSSSCFSCRHS
ncbi:MAG: hypothetical protein AABZ06_13115 [Bdellovibrionota bacterium]